MICARCGDQRAEDGLGYKNCGISFGLGNCTPKDPRFTVGDHQWQKAIYLIANPCMSQFGEWRFRKSSKEEALRLMTGQAVMSAIGTAREAKLFAVVFDFSEVQYGASLVCRLEPGDMAVVILIHDITTLPQHQDITPETLGQIGHTIAILERMA